VTLGDRPNALSSAYPWLAFEMTPL
jgi:hypothetical protein